VPCPPPQKKKNLTNVILTAMIYDMHYA